MDTELEEKTKSRSLDAPDGVGQITKEVSEDAHVLNNLLQSLDASAGEAGPVTNMLKEMGG